MRDIETLRPARGHLTIISGPPGSGKLATVRAEARPGDLIIDRRVICRSLVGKDYDPSLQALIEHKRLAMMHGLATARGRSWLTSEDPAEVDALTKRLRPAVVIEMVTSPAACRRTIQADPMRPPLQRRIDVEATRAWAYRAARAWFA